MVLSKLKESQPLGTRLKKYEIITCIMNVWSYMEISPNEKSAPTEKVRLLTDRKQTDKH